MPSPISPCKMPIFRLPVPLLSGRAMNTQNQIQWGYEMAKWKLWEIGIQGSLNEFLDSLGSSIQIKIVNKTDNIVLDSWFCIFRFWKKCWISPNWSKITENVSEHNFSFTIFLGATYAKDYLKKPSRRRRWVWWVLGNPASGIAEMEGTMDALCSSPEWPRHDTWDQCALEASNLGTLGSCVPPMHPSIHCTTWKVEGYASRLARWRKET